MPTLIIIELLKQFFEGPVTNKFPAKYIPKSVTKFIEEAKKGKKKLNPPVELPPEGFRGKLIYDKEKCTGCNLCVKVCPANAIEFLNENKKIRIYISRCAFCAQCIDVCPVKVLAMSNEFLLADYDKYSKELIVE